jgi:hypothetical protein
MEESSTLKILREVVKQGLSGIGGDFWINFVMAGIHGAPWIWLLTLGK